MLLYAHAKFNRTIAQRAVRCMHAKKIGTKSGAARAAPAAPLPPALQLERLKTEGVVDFFQAVKSARIQRAGLVSDAVSPSLF